MITFNTMYRNDDSKFFLSVNEWLGALYTASNTEIEGQNDQNIFFASLINLQNKIQHNFQDSKLFVQALTHKTFYLENKNIVYGDNEKLEFLGDAVLGYLISDYLYHQFPELNEGQLSKLRVTLVNEESFAKLARFLKLDENLFLGKGEYKNKGQDKNSLLADAFEALIGAMSLENSIEELKNKFFAITDAYEKETQLKFIDLENASEYDSKTKLQELVMEKKGIAPQYKFQEKENGFEVELWIGDQLVGNKFGISKKKTEKELAKLVLENNLI